MNTKTSIEDKLLEDFRSLPEKQKAKFLKLIEDLKIAAKKSKKKSTEKLSEEEAEFLKMLEARHLKIDPEVDVDDLMKDLNDGLP